MFRKILIANRGEIAVRVARACAEMGISSVAVYSDVDKAALHVRVADEALSVGPAAASESYLRIDRLIEAAKKSGAEAVHPGYGFLSENASFAQACVDAGLVFIGPPASAIEAMGSKIAARERMLQAGVPVVPGTTLSASDSDELLAVADEIGYPVMLKASAGGGGKGMRLVRRPQDLPSAFDQARSEAERAFGDPAVYLEKAIVRPRHVEVQVLCDAHGGAVHLGERECSLQRRHQKVLEETPSPFIERFPAVREKLTAAALDAARAVGYVSAGTVEFLVDAEANFYFLEMNTRLQVEHPVTEMVTGVDLVREQIRIAAGEPLGYRQDAIRPRGWAIECRLYAEDPEAGFLPSPGELLDFHVPQWPGVRLDAGAEAGSTIPMEYDPLLGKMVVWAESRPAAVRKLQAVLDACRVGGVASTLPLFRRLVADPDFQAGEFHTHWLEPFTAQAPAAEPPDPLEDAVVLTVAAALERRRGQQVAPAAPSRSAWKLAGRALLAGVRGRR